MSRREGAHENVVFGINPVLEQLRARPEGAEQLYLAEGMVPKAQAAEILSRARDAGLKVQKLPRERLHALAGGGVHQGVVLEVKEFEYLELPDLIDAARADEGGRPPLIVLLDGIQDPQNFGAILRSAHALGAHGVVIPKDRAVGVTGAVLKASAGAAAHTPVARVTNLSRALEELKEAGFWIAAADPEGNQALHEAKLVGALALVVGAEGPGVRKGVLEHCDFRLRIPMSGEVASLNASVSAALLLYEVQRQRLSPAKVPAKGQK